MGSHNVKNYTESAFSQRTVTLDGEHITTWNKHLLEAYVVYVGGIHGLSFTSITKTMWSLLRSKHLT